LSDICLLRISGPPPASSLGRCSPCERAGLRWPC